MLRRGAGERRRRGAQAVGVDVADVTEADGHDDPVGAGNGDRLTGGAGEPVGFERRPVQTDLARDRTLGGHAHTDARSLAFGVDRAVETETDETAALASLMVEQSDDTARRLTERENSVRTPSARVAPSYHS